MPQYGFFFDQSRCIGCHACETACKSWNMLPPGPLKPLRVHEWEEGSFPDVVEHFLIIHCFHCSNPVCIDASSARALYKEEKYGAVLLDPDKATMVRDAAAACPYGAIVFESDDFNAKAFKCTMCIDRLEQGLLPVCVLACPMRALDFGPLDELQKKYGTRSELQGLPPSTLTKPSVVYKPMEPKKKLIPYDSEKALKLLAERKQGLPPIYTDVREVKEIPAGLRSRDKLILKPSNVEELLRLTKNDDG
jgi:anaerobic dimethyl sulfoxide reductase subunit B (iron-sulfur subunit)